MMKKLREQKIFDKVATHLLTQNKKAEDDKGCRYRTADGRKCAIGCLISDEEYLLSFEGKNVFSGGVGTLLEGKGFDLPFLGRLQNIHDYRDVADWPEKLTLFAKDNGLNTDVFGRI